MMARMIPVSLHFSDVPTGWKKIVTDKQQLATGFACSSRTISPDEQCYRLICTRASKKSSAQLQTQMWCLPPSNGPFSSKQLANQLLPDSVRFLVAKNILEPIQCSQAQMKECVVEFVHQRHPPLHGFPDAFPPRSFWQNTLTYPNTLCDIPVSKWNSDHKTSTKVTGAWLQPNILHSEIPRHAYLFAWIQNNAMTCMIWKQNWTVQNWTVQ